MVVIGVFATVTLGLLIVFLFPTRLFQQDYINIRRRMAEEFGKVRACDGANPLYGDLDALSKSAGPQGDASAGKSERNKAQPWASSLWKRLESLVQQANLPIGLGHFLVLAAVVGMGTAALGAWLGGWLVGLAACSTGSSAPFFLQ
jgi:hypothetical protein